ncbi:alkaline phosphatase [Cyclobacterium sp. 1_MG-2023]|uniref:alkaline phosphatase n=1 Tax=Cyclobacterium sp. 1_MG-2023 TaxID=3062681 RepID=UPI0026E3A4BB|nr:alkaline phosphatase [Cyclobacterium sp. 1_MG-2023]MDO6439264.1 alkaline phosphatase [Cyclobacterium sp. 1_MG-2023]
MQPNQQTALKTLVFFLTILSLSGQIFGQQRGIHSHNDYLQDAPFWEAYANGATSIEADVILKGNTLYVAHEKESIKEGQTLTSLYLDPLLKAKNLGLGSQKPLQLLVDLKTEAYSTLDKVLEVIQPYEELWEDPQNPFVKIVISGNRPKVADYTNYPFPVFFDYQSLTELADLPLEKIELFSLSFKDYSQWNGKGRLVDQDIEKIKKVVDKVHALGKPFRFWATPDSKTSWKALSELGIDFINTDNPYAANEYLSSLDKRFYQTTNLSEIYTPTFEKDGIKGPLDNVILLIGDGNGLAQISAAMYGNGNELTLTQLKNIGLLKTQSEDDFTTDSAAAGTALATGNKVKNRSVGALPDGSPAQNLPEVLSSQGFVTGIVTTDNLTGATPAAFYAHRTERDLTMEIASDLAKSPLNLFIGGGKNDFTKFEQDETINLKNADFELSGSLEDLAKSKSERVGFFASQNELPKVMNGRAGYLSTATKASLQFLTSKNKPFFLMVEGAFIDSGGHINDSQTVIEEGIDFDQAIAEALKFADQNGRTLVIITADHETGGITLPQGNMKDHKVELEFTSEDHTAIMVPIFAYGPQSDLFRGVYENTEVFNKINQVLGVK